MKTTTEMIIEAREEIKDAMAGNACNAPEWLYELMSDSLTDEQVLLDMYSDYWDSSLKYYGIKPLLTQ